MEPTAETAAQRLAALRDRRPLVHCLTNPVTVNFTANALLALGASPVMAGSREEVGEVSARAGALVLNLGTPDPERVEAMIRAGRSAAGAGRPIVFDPVGVGATEFRGRSAGRILSALPVAVVRGNASEIRALASAGPAAPGVDAVDPEDAAAAGTVAAGLKTVVAVTGPVDRVTDGSRSVRIPHGHPLMARVSGTGCAATALIGAFLAVEPDGLRAAAAALACWGLAGERAARRTAGPGSFAAALLDALYALAPEDLLREARLEEADP